MLFLTSKKIHEAVNEINNVQFEKILTKKDIKLKQFTNFELEQASMQFKEENNSIIDCLKKLWINAIIMWSLFGLILLMFFIWIGLMARVGGADLSNSYIPLEINIPLLFFILISVLLHWMWFSKISKINYDSVAKLYFFLLSESIENNNYQYLPQNISWWIFKYKNQEEKQTLIADSAKKKVFKKARRSNKNLNQKIVSLIQVKQFTALGIQSLLNNNKQNNQDEKTKESEQK